MRLSSSWKNRLIRKNSSPNQRSAWQTFTPRLEVLEDRTVPSTVSWINAVGGDWDTPSNWSTNALPGPSDDVVISQSGITDNPLANMGIG